MFEHILFAIPKIDLTAEQITVIAGAFLSVMFTYLPILQTKFAGMSSEAKSGIMLGMLAFITAAVTAMDYFGGIDAGLEFGPGWGWDIFWMYFFAAVSNQTTYRLSPPPKVVKVAILERNMDEAAEFVGEQP